MSLNFDIITEITDIEMIARGVGVDARHYLNHTYGRGSWRKLKGKAIVKYENSQVWLIELVRGT